MAREERTNSSYSKKERVIERERKRKNARESDQREMKIPEENFRLDGSASNERNTGREQRQIRIFFPKRERRLQQTFCCIHKETIT